MKMRIIFLLSGLFLIIVENNISKVLAQTNNYNLNSNLAQANICSANLESQINQIINRPDLAQSYWGIIVKNLDTGEIIYQLNADKFFIPASNTKLLTSAAALLQLGADYRFETKFYAIGKPPHLDSLRLVGSGDPSLNTAKLQEVTTQLKQLGVTSINQIIIDNSYFQEAAINPHWEWEDVYSYYGVPVTSVILNENSFDLTILPQKLHEPVKITVSDPIAAQQWYIKNHAITATENTPYNITIDGELGKQNLIIKGNLPINSQPDIWGLAIPDPVNYLIAVWKNILSQNNIQVHEFTSNFNPNINKNEYQIINIKSDDLSNLIIKLNQESNNLYAEVLRHKLGQELNNIKGIDAITQILTKLGVNPNSYSLTDGSGLSRHNLISPQAIVETLELMNQNNLKEIYHQSLPIAGVSGTLKKRFINTPIQGYLSAKTGTLSGNSALSGYLEIPNQSPLVFSIMVNQSHQSSATLREAIDEIVLLLSDCS